MDNLINKFWWCIKRSFTDSFEAVFVRPFVRLFNVNKMCGKCKHLKCVIYDFAEYHCEKYRKEHYEKHDFEDSDEAYNSYDKSRVKEKQDFILRCVSCLNK